MMVPDQFYEKFDGKNPKMQHRDAGKEDVMMTRAALALCENIDWNVGRILKKLDDLQLRDNTIVVFFTDNGPNSYRWNGGMKGRKGSIDEGGLRSPFFIRWPHWIPAGSSIGNIAGAIDLLPTLTDLANIKLKTNKPIDGSSLKQMLLRQSTGWPSRRLFSIKRNQVSIRTERYRFDTQGQLFHIAKDRGQRKNIADQHPELVSYLRRQAREHAEEMAKHFKQNADRPFTVGYGPSSTLTARDGKQHGTIQRSSKAPNNSFFTNWTSPDDAITWNIDVAKSGKYEAVLHYTCAKGDEGTIVRLSMAESENTLEAKITEAFDPPLYDKSKERVAKSHYFVKDFKRLWLGIIELQKGQGTLRLDARDIKGKQVVDVHSLDLIVKDRGKN